ncbi:MAG: DNA alkylation repair protein [Thermoplasmata archaeon]
MEYDDIIKRLESLADPKRLEGMERYAIAARTAYGVSVPDLRKIAREIRVDHDLAQQLWASNIRETRILASMIDDPEIVTEEQMERWVRDFDSWEICDQCCMNLFERSKLAYQKCLEWSSREEEFVKRAGFALMARLAVSDKEADDELFENFLHIIEGQASDDRNFVKKAINWALRQIGKRNIALNKKAIAAAERIGALDSRSARWVASDAIRELTSEAVQKRLRG